MPAPQGAIVDEVDRAALDAFLSGRTDDIDIDPLEDLAHVLGLTVGQLIGERAAGNDGIVGHAYRQPALSPKRPTPAKRSKLRFGDWHCASVHRLTVSVYRLGRLVVRRSPALTSYLLQPFSNCCKVVSSTRARHCFLPSFLPIGRRATRAKNDRVAGHGRLDPHSKNGRLISAAVEFIERVARYDSPNHRPQKFPGVHAVMEMRVRPDERPNTRRPARCRRDLTNSAARPTGNAARFR